jgi:ATP-dependent RNA helicase DDX19/DBP5
MTQTIIFVNSKAFAETLFDILRKASLQVVIIFGKMDNQERDEMIEKFRTGKIAVIITTNMLARGIDVPEVQIVINFDVPIMMGFTQEEKQGDPENYLHRIGRTGRFGTKGLAITIYDREVDEIYLNQILDHYNMKDKCKPLSGPEQLTDLLAEIRNQ